MNIQLIRNASLWIEYHGKTILVDPMFSDQGVNPPIMNSANDRRNPLVSLPDDINHWTTPDLIIVTHLHQDHWDAQAIEILPHSTPILCQSGNRQQIMDEGFTSVTEVTTVEQWEEIQFSRVGGHHGRGEIAEKMGQVSGFVLQAKGEPTLYIAGDTIWCEEVQEALEQYHPQVTVVNAGGARFVEGDPITMDKHDVEQVCQYAPQTKVIAVHMEAINHCLLTREQLATYVEEKGYAEQVVILQDGQHIEYSF